MLCFRTNIAQAIEYGRMNQFKTSSGMRYNANKVMVLLTDGTADRDAADGYNKLSGQTHRKLPLSVQDGDERPALEDDLPGGETPARGDGLGLHSVAVGRLLLHDRRMMNGGGAASACTSLMPARRRPLPELFLRTTDRALQVFAALGHLLPWSAKDLLRCV